MHDTLSLIVVQNTVSKKKIERNKMPALEVVGGWWVGGKRASV